MTSLNNMSTHNIRMADPWVTEHEVSVVTDMMRNGWANYDYVEKFQPEFAAYHDRAYGIMTPNCTSALHLLLLALGIGQGDEVIVPECTWTGSVAPITYTGATPVFCDIEERNWCLDPESVLQRVSPKTKAIIVVDLYGNMPQMERLAQIGEDRGIALIEDAAEALGSKYKGKKAGSFGVGSVFSFHRTKTLTTGEGGMLLLDDHSLYERAMFLRDHGRSQSVPYYTIEATPKYMPSNLQAAMGYGQFQRLAELIAKKRQIFFGYKKRLAGVADMVLNEESNDVYNGVWATSLVLGKSHNMSKQLLMQGLQKQGLPSRPFFYPMSMLPAYASYGTGDQIRNPVAYDVSARGITLPAAYQMTEDQLDIYCAGIKNILHG